MDGIVFMLGNGLVKKERKSSENKMVKLEREARRIRKKVSVEIFLRKILGTHLIEKKF